MSPPELLEPGPPARSDRDLAIVTAGFALVAAAVAATFVLLPRGFGILLVLALAYPVVRVLRHLLRPPGGRAPRIRLDDAGIDFGGVLRYRWQDITQVEPGALVQRNGRLAPGRVLLRLNRLAPVHPIAATLQSVGLEPGDGYFDLAIPPAYGLTAEELAERIERRRRPPRPR